MNRVLNQLTIKAKLTLLVTVNALFFIIASGYAIQQMSLIGDEIGGIAERDLPLINVVSDITIHQIEMEVLFERAGRFGVMMAHEEGAFAHFEKVVAAFNTLSIQVNDEILRGEALVEQAQEHAKTEAMRQEFGAVFDGLKAIEKENHQFKINAQLAFNLLKSGEIQAAEMLTEEVELLADNVAHNLNSVFTKVKRFTEKAAGTAEQHEQSAEQWLMGIVITALVLGVLLAMATINNIKRSLVIGMGAMQRIADGDLSKAVTIEGKDEIADMLVALEQMRAQLADVIEGIDRSSATLSSASEELAAASEESSQSVYQQKQETEQLAAAMNEMAATVQEVADSTSSAAEAAREAMSESEHGRIAVSDTISSINVLSDEVQRSSDAIKKLGDESDNIGMVLDVIRGIAEQTNLLALNAAIEAARAGEQGRGFAVVADEVRTLATRTHNSTQEIQSMIERLQVGARDSIHMMDGSRKKMVESVNKATEAGSVLEVVLDAVTRITDMNNQIASATEQQSTVTEELNRNIVTISEVADQNACTSHQTAQASTELAKTAVELKGMVEIFKLV